MGIEGLPPVGLSPPSPLLHGAPKRRAALCGCWHPAPRAGRRQSPCKGLSGSRHGGMLLGTEKLPVPLPYAGDFHCGKSCQGAQGLQQLVTGWTR